MAFLVGESAPILGVAAWSAFWRMDRAQLVPLANRLRIAIPDGTDLYGLLALLAQHILPEL